VALKQSPSVALFVSLLVVEKQAPMPWNQLRRWLLVASVVTGGLFFGGRPPSPVVAAESGEANWQGEYAGTLTDPSGRAQWTGLQVVAQGKGDYLGVELTGGLPGNRWNMRDRVEAVGRAVGTPELVLASSTRQYTVDGWRVRVTDRQGQPLGTLQRYVRTSQTLGAPPPANAIVLFSGGPTSELKNAKITPEGLLQVGCETTRAYRDFCLHVEFRTPSMPEARGQARGNSGVYLQGRYEVQILDSFGLVSQNNDCGSLYKQRPPSLNMSFPPETWQTYEIDFRAARFDDQGQKTEPARLTVFHNGIKIHKNVELAGKTGAGAAEGPDPRPIKFQDHGDKVLYRNLWIVEK
jgi:hypothetical protein